MRMKMNDFEAIMKLIMSEGLATIDSITDEELERILNENLAS